MRRDRRLFVCALLLALTAAIVDTSTDETRTQPLHRPILILVSLDGWRWDYLKHFAPPALMAIAARGVVSEGLVPVFPSKTFPNHYTIVTGLYPDRHGLVSNTIRDPFLPGRFSLSNHDTQQDTRWWGGVPLWVTVERQGQIAGTMFWPGSDVEIAGDRPTEWRRYDGGVANADRVDQLLSWLSRPERERPTLLTLYFSDVDSAGHDFGPDSPQMREAIEGLDNAMARLVRGIDAAGLTPRVNLVVVSDHGMAPNAPERTILVDDLVDPESIEMIDVSPILAVASRTGSVEALYRALHGKHPALHVYRAEELPARYRLAGHPRVPPIMAVADEGWAITTRARVAREPDGPGGNHGYDPAHRSMHGLFIAAGPAFKAGVTVPAFDIVHVYELLCRVLGIEPEPNDGDPTVTAGFLR